MFQALADENFSKPFVVLAHKLFCDITAKGKHWYFKWIELA